MSVASLGSSASAALFHALGHHRAHKPQQAGSMADVLAQLTGGSSSQGSNSQGVAASGSGSAAGTIAQDLLSMLGAGDGQTKPPASAASAYGAGTQLG